MTEWQGSTEWWNSDLFSTDFSSAAPPAPAPAAYTSPVATPKALALPAPVSTPPAEPPSARATAPPTPPAAAPPVATAAASHFVVDAQHQPNTSHTAKATGSNSKQHARETPTKKQSWFEFLVSV